MDKQPQMDIKGLQIKGHLDKVWLDILISLIAYIAAPLFGLGYLLVICIHRYLWPHYKSYLAFSFSAQLGLTSFMFIGLLVMLLRSQLNTESIYFFAPIIIQFILIPLGLLLFYYFTTKLWTYIWLTIINLDSIIVLAQSDSILNFTFIFGLLFRLLIIFTLWMGWFKERPLLEPKASLHL